MMVGAEGLILRAPDSFADSIVVLYRVLSGDLY
jgi:hypothetical protein